MNYLEKYVHVFHHPHAAVALLLSFEREHIRCPGAQTKADGGPRAENSATQIDEW